MADFFGTQFTPSELELRALRVNPAHRSDEAALTRRRWFDYRHMSPALATYYYAHCYKVQTQRFYAMCVDEGRASDARAFTPDDIFNSRDMTSMWLARSFADEHRLPYPFVLEFAMKRFIARTQHQFPRPNQLYGEELELDVLVAWKERMGSQITMALSPRFRMHGYKGELVQAEHVKFVADQIMQRSGPRFRLIARMLKESLMTHHMATLLFGQVEADAAERYRAQFM